MFLNVNFLFKDLFHRSFEMKWCHCTSLFLAWESRTACDGLIAFNRGEVFEKTACSCRRSRENRNVSSLKSKLLLIPLKVLVGKTVC